MGCHEGAVKISSAELGKRLGCSQQTASRRIIDLEEAGFITRELLPKGQRIGISPVGIELLIEIYLDLKEVFEEKKEMQIKLTGIVTSGFGEGRYYMEKGPYRDEFKRLLRFDPYPGTLNLRLSRRSDLEARKELDRLEGLIVRGFPDEGRTFGDVKCFRALIGGIEGAVVMPLRSHHGPDHLEVVAPVKLRDELELEDGKGVVVEVVL